MASFTIDNAFLTEFDSVFQTMLRYQGYTLIGGTIQENVIGANKLVRQMSVGDAIDITGQGATTEYIQTNYDRRRLEPKDFAASLLIDDVDMRQMGTMNLDQYAAEMANSCGKKIDQYILDGISGGSYSEAQGGMVTLPSTPTEKAVGSIDGSEYDATQVIPWMDYRLGDNNYGHASLAVKAGLNSAKIAKAVVKLRENFAHGALVCVASEYAMSTMRSDPRVANSLFGTQKTLADGSLTTPYGGVDAFIPCELVPKSNKSYVNDSGTISGTANGVTVEHAYVYCVPHIRLGVGAPVYLKNGTDASRYLNQTLIYQGAYGCTRMFETAVVVIEIAKQTPASSEDTQKAWNY